MAGDEDRLAVREEVADQVRDRVALAGAGRPLHEHRTSLVEPTDHAALLAIRVARQQDLGGLVVATRATPGVDADDAEQRLRQLLEPRQDLEVALDRVGEALVAIAEIERRLPIHVRPRPAPDVLHRLGVHAVLPASLHEILEELARARAAERMDLLRRDPLLERRQPLRIDLEVAQQRRVQARWIAGLHDGELRLARIELELHALEQQRMPDDLAIVRRDQDPVAEKQLELLRLALELAPLREQIGEQPRRRDDVALRVLPLPSLLEPGLERENALLVV